MSSFIKLAIMAFGFITLSAATASASRICDDLWFTRNAVLDQAGYCFGSALGQAQFDNSDCTGQDITLTPAQTAFVTGIQQIEASYDCAVDSSRTTLDVPDIPARKQLTLQPMPHAEMHGWACLGWLGPEVALHAGPGANTPQIGRIGQGEWVSIGGHEMVDGWGYVSTFDATWDDFRSGGWMPMTGEFSCEREAG